MRRVAFVGLLLMLVTAGAAGAADRYAVIITGASGAPDLAAQYEDWRARLVTVLADKLAFGRDRVVALGERPGDRVQVATRENVGRVIESLSRRMHHADLLLVVLIGHGTFDGTVAKFNLPGPDLDASEWAGLLRPVPGQLVVVNTTGASFPFLAALSVKGRVVVTATDSRAARFDTVFPEYFVKALEEAAAGAPNGDRVSIWDVFLATTSGVRSYYERKGLMPVEHALLDDLGDGFGKDAEQPGTDPSFAQTLFLTADRADASTDGAIRQLASRRDDLLAEIQKLKVKKTTMEPGDYDAQMEKLLVDLARVSHELRARGGGSPT